MGAGERVAIVTGGSRGIGRGIVRELAKLGWSLGVNYRSRPDEADRACEEARRLGAPRAVPIGADVADLHQCATMLERIATCFDTLDLWVNNAGVAPETRSDLLALTPESWDRVLGINLRGPFFLTQRVARRMIEQVEARSGAAPQIVFVTSVSSTFASTQRGEYCVSKAGASMVVRLFADRLAPHGVRVYEVRPGIIATEMTASVHEVYERKIQDGISPLRRWGAPEDVGRAVVAIAEGAFPFSTGEVLHVDGGLNLPRL